MIEMHKNIRYKTIGMILTGVICSVSLSGCGMAIAGLNTEKALADSSAIVHNAENFTFEVIPETFEISLKNKNGNIRVSEAMPKRKVSGFKESTNKVQWVYPEEQVAVSVEKLDNKLQVLFSYLGGEKMAFQWPRITGSQYYLPLGEGKRIPQGDKLWENYLKEQSFNMMEQFSMPFFAVEQGNQAVVYIADQAYHKTVTFKNDQKLTLEAEHSFTTLEPVKTFGYQIYLTNNNPVEIASVYKQEAIKNHKFLTLKEKAGANPNIEQLYGAAHVYFWNENLIAEDDIHWKKFNAGVKGGALQKLLALETQNTDLKELKNTLKQMAKQDYVDSYQKATVVNWLSEILKMPAEQTLQGWGIKDKNIWKKTLNMTRTEQIQWNKTILYNNLPGVFEPVDQWANSKTTDLLLDMKNSGIEKAWIGLNNWEEAMAKPEIIQKAKSLGYLIGTYDSYHSIHPKGKAQWNTAEFPDEALFEKATVTNEKGEKIEGFNKVGRKLNPSLAMPYVKQRVENLLQEKLNFNSWFVDCDATGEVYEDYSKGVMTSKAQDISARLERLDFIADQKKMVVGSEGGNDFAAAHIAFAHGIELPTFSWMDDDMRQNKKSDYFVGTWFAKKGGVPEHFGKEIPLKENLAHLFLNPVYDVPLFKLVYNDAVITTYHWDWSSYKLKDFVKQRMLREVLFNVPPLYHLDQESWGKYKPSIVSHLKIWQAFSEKAIQLPMTAFEYKSQDHLIQETRFGQNLKVIANFGKQAVSLEGYQIPAQSLIIVEGDNVVHYSPNL